MGPCQPSLGSRRGCLYFWLWCRHVGEQATSGTWYLAWLLSPTMACTVVVDITSTTTGRSHGYGQPCDPSRSAGLVRPSARTVVDQDWSTTCRCALRPRALAHGKLYPLGTAWRTRVPRGCAKPCLGPGRAGLAALVRTVVLTRASL